MFSLANGKLIRINSDGSDGEPIQTKNSSLTIGTSILSDYCVSDTSEPSTHLAYEISTDNLGRVSTAALVKNVISESFIAVKKKQRINCCMKTPLNLIFLCCEISFVFFKFRLQFRINVVHNCWLIVNQCRQYDLSSPTAKSKYRTVSDSAGFIHKMQHCR